MKKQLLILFFLIPASLFSQSGQKFAVYYKQNRSYSSTTITSSEIKIDVQGDQQTIERMKQSGMKLQTVIHLTNSRQTTAKTGSMDSAGAIPVVFDYLADGTTSSVNDKPYEKKSPLSGMSVNAFYIEGKQFLLDSAKNNNLDPDKRSKILRDLDMSLNQIIFPDKILKIGDQFIQDIPMEIPVSGLKPIRVTMSLIYTLVDTLNSKAHFIIMEKIRSDSDPQTKIDLHGSGSGSAWYDIRNNFVLSHDTSSDINIKVYSPGMTMYVNLSTRISQTNKVE